MTAGELVGAIVVGAIAVLLLLTFWPFVLCLLGAGVVYIGVVLVRDPDETIRIIGMVGILVGAGMFFWGAMMVWAMFGGSAPRGRKGK